MCPVPNGLTEEPLNPRQIARIEAVHQGFLYQHLYAVQILFSQQDLGWNCVRIERDEDIEIGMPEQRAYVQLKKRASTLISSDIDVSIEQFATIQAEHEAGRRDGSPRLWIVSNAAPSDKLSARIASDEWPRAVFLRTPTFTNARKNDLPLPGASIAEEFARCVALAGRVEHSTLTPETLVWKLAAWVQSVAAGGLRDHVITPASFHPLLEQLCGPAAAISEPCIEVPRTGS